MHSVNNSSIVSRPSPLVLVVDDNEKNRKLVRLILQKEYEVIEAEDGEQAVRLAGEIMPDLILMDIQMPVMDGNEALKLLRANKITSIIPVIALTSYAMTGDRDKFLAEGFNGYASKPLNTRELLEIAKKYVHG